MMKIILLTSALIVTNALAFGQVDEPVVRDNRKESIHEKLALYHSPIHLQHTGSPADFYTNLEYDLDSYVENNWSYITNEAPSAAWSYYSVVETATHYFILYTFYHPRNWAEKYSPAEEHANDWHGALCVITKKGQYGELDAMITNEEDDFYSYVRRGSGFSSSANENVDGSIFFGDTAYYGFGKHPGIQQKKYGHGLKALAYIPSKRSNYRLGEIKKSNKIGWGATPQLKEPLTYGLISMFYSSRNKSNFGNYLNDESETPWEKQLLHIQGVAYTYYKWGVLLGSDEYGCGDGVYLTCKKNVCKAPWMWDDKDDGPNYPGTIAIDPAQLVKYYFKVPEAFSLKYVSNLYLSDLKEKGYNNNKLPEGWPEKLDLNALLNKLE